MLEQDPIIPANTRLNHRATVLTNQLAEHASKYRVTVHDNGLDVPIIDCGIRSRGGLEAGRRLAEICLSGLAKVEFIDSAIHGTSCLMVQVVTDHPVEACLCSQYAGWRISNDDFFCMGSGPMRALAAKEDLFASLGYRETSEVAVGVLECADFPPPDTGTMLAEACDVQPRKLQLLVARTSSFAGTVQIVARSVETALHKLYELKANLGQVTSAVGMAPLPPVGGDDLTAMGRTNDAILYGARVHLWVNGCDDYWNDLAPRIPSCSSPVYGRTFMDLFDACGRDFYQMDPLLFSPAEIVIFNMTSGRQFSAGSIHPDMLTRSFSATSSG
jgi:methenyltetrahydromethanopterin cyclohydrolase